MTWHQLSTLANLEEMTLFEGKQRNPPPPTLGSTLTHVFCNSLVFLGLLSNSYFDPSAVPKVTADIHSKLAEGEGESQQERNAGSKCCNANRGTVLMTA